MSYKTQCGPGLLIGIPTLYRPVSLEWAFAHKSLTPPINYNSSYMVVPGKAVDVARNEIAEEAVKQECKYLFFMSDDVEVPAHTLKQLIFRMEQNENLAVVGGVYSTKCDPSAPLVFRENGQGSYWDWKIGEYFWVSGLGMDCTLIRVSALDKIPKPWFKTVDTDQFLDGINKAEMWTEDLYFCNKVREAGFEVFCDSSIICNHWDAVNHRAYSIPANSKPFRRLSTEKTKKAVDLGCGPVNRSDSFPEHELVRVDIREECNPDYRCDVSCTPFANAEFDIVFSSHVLEHFPREKWEAALDEWIRILKKTGELILCLPNIMWAVEGLNNPSLGYGENDILNVLYGAQSNPFDYHYNAWYPAKLEKILRDKGFKDIDFVHQGYNMICNARFTEKEKLVCNCTTKADKQMFCDCGKGAKLEPINIKEDHPLKRSSDILEPVKDFYKVMNA